MWIGLTSDVHLEDTEGSIGRLRSALEDLGQVDTLVLAGDYAWLMDPVPAVSNVCALARRAHPSATILAVLGNHDFWLSGKNRSLDDMWIQLNEIRSLFRSHGVCFLDESPPVDVTDANGETVTFFGHTGWYHEDPNTNDAKHMARDAPNGIHYLMRWRALNAFLDSFDRLPSENQNPTVCVTHLPITADNKTLRNLNWDYKLGDHCASRGVKVFLEGHTHQYHYGTRTCEHRAIKFNCGSDYGKPRALKFELTREWYQNL
jgi:predicted phosphodiesterase